MNSSPPKINVKNSIAEKIALVRKNFHTGRTKSITYRLQQLDQLKKFLKECELKIEKALYDDLRRPNLEVMTGDISITLAEIEYTKKNLSKWVKPKRVKTTMAVQPAKGYLYPEPLGTVLIISPWNYPLQLALIPLIGAIAAGNTAIIKPSELASATSALLAEQLPRYLDDDCYKVIEGGIELTTELLAEQFDHIFYTGNGQVGRIVMEAAAKHLTPVTLELGGKSPCIIDKDTDLDVAVRRIFFGKFFNAGQTCVATDYVLVHEAIEEALLTKMKKTLHDFYGKNPENSPDFARIINQKHHERLVKLLSGNGDIYIGGQHNQKDCYIAPTILSNVPEHAPIMSDEIFGPILPVLKVKNIDAAIDFINARPKPLALYLYSNDKNIQQQVLMNTSSGGVCINHCTLHTIIPNLPFGGVGPSGMGAYHGKFSFDTFSHFKAVLIKPTKIDPPFIYPPYNKIKKRLLRWLL